MLCNQYRAIKQVSKKKIQKKKLSSVYKEPVHSSTTGPSLFFSFQFSYLCPLIFYGAYDVKPWSCRADKSFVCFLVLMLGRHQCFMFWSNTIECCIIWRLQRRKILGLVKRCCWRFIPKYIWYILEVYCSNFILLRFILIIKDFVYCNLLNIHFYQQSLKKKKERKKKIYNHLSHSPLTTKIS